MMNNLKSGGMMKQILQMQKQLKQAQKELEKATVTGSSGNGAIEITMTGSVYVGLCLTSHDPAAVSIAEFSGVQTTGALGQWQVAEIGVDHPENSSEDVYVTLEDSFGRTASVSYPQGATVRAWSPWRIPLVDFTGVSLGSVRKVSIGVGNPTAPALGGTGVVYFDDIQVARPAPAEPNDVGTE